MVGWLVGGRPGEYAMSQEQDSFTPEEKTRNIGEEETDGEVKTFNFQEVWVKTEYSAFMFGVITEYRSEY